MKWSTSKLNALLRKMERGAQSCCENPFVTAVRQWAEELRQCRIEPTRIKPQRAKPRRGRAKDPEFLSWMANQPCLVTGKLPATTHHVRSFGSPKDDRRTIRLIAELHMLTHEKPGQACIERLGKRVFELSYKIDIEAAIKDYNQRYKQEKVNG